jgi:hypothetical protein
MVPPQQDAPRHWAGRYRYWLCGDTVCPGQDQRCSGAHEPGQDSKGEVCFIPIVSFTKLWLLTRWPSLRRRFEQNQEDCTFTVLALLPTATTNILEAMNTEKITYDIQQMKGSATTKSIKSIGSTSPPSTSEANATDEDGRSIVSLPSHSESAMSVSQILGLPPPEPPKAPAAANTDAPASPESVPPKPRKTKRQLWDDLTISCKSLYYLV